MQTLDTYMAIICRGTNLPHILPVNLAHS